MSSDAALDSLVRDLAGRNSNEKHTEACQKRLDAEAQAATARAAARFATLSPVPTSILVLTSQDCPPHNAGRKSQHKSQSREVLATEVAQHKAVQQLASMFCKLAGDHMGSKWFQHFEAWLFSRRGSRCRTGPHSILPVEASSHLAQQELQRKLVATGMAKALAESICVELSRLPAHLHERAKQPVPASVKVKVVQCVGQQGRVPKIKLTCLGVSLEINLTHYNKLRLLHAHASGDTEHHETTFCQHAMALLLRYSSLQGTHYRGGGFQAAVHPEVLDELCSRFSTQLECFASPLNCRWPSFCSMFPDTDAPFGSSGDFFQFFPQRGSFEANPPFDRSFVSSMTAHMQKLLLQTEEALMFAVIIPAWEDAKCWQALRDSDFCRHHLLLPAGQHGYCEGAQHNRANQFRVSSTASSIFFLQNDAAVKQWPVLQEHIEAITDAFRPRKPASEGRIGSSTGKQHANDLMLYGELSRQEDHSQDAKFTATEIGDAVKTLHRTEGPCSEADHSSDEERASNRDTTPSRSRLAVSDVSLTKKQKRQTGNKSKRKQSVASHTGKYADEATARAVLASVAKEDLLQGMIQTQKDTENQLPEGNAAGGGKASGAKGDDGVVVFAMSASQRLKLRKNREKIGKRRQRT